MQSRMDALNPPLKPALILLIILIEGFVTVAVEMLTIRQLITVVGNSVIITSIIIGIFLLFLAAGYYRGGQYQGDYHRILKMNFIGSALLLGVGISYTFVQVFFYLQFTYLVSNELIALSLYLLLITAPLVFLLGQTVPITTNLFQGERHVGSISGKVLGLSTVGSFLGSIISTLVLMNYLGVAWTIVINFCLLVLLILLLVSSSKEGVLVAFISLFTLFVVVLNIVMEQRLFVKTNNYADYDILQNQYSSITHTVGNTLTINNAPSSFLSWDHKGFAYIEEIKRILFQELKLKDKDILVLGAGGFTLSAESNFSNRFIYVDVDRALPDIVINQFIDRVNGRFVHQDARRFLTSTSQKFDAIVSDVFSNRRTIPFHLLTREYFQTIKAALKPNGVAIFNVIANPMMQDHYSRRMDNTIRCVFHNCVTTVMPYHNGISNLLYICPFGDNNDRNVYTDNKNTAMIDIYGNK